jgi:hypothetical protein
VVSNVYVAEAASGPDVAFGGEPRTFRSIDPTPHRRIGKIYT